MWTLRSHSSPPRIVAKPSLSCALPLAQRLDLGAGEHDAALDPLEQVVAVRGVAVRRDVPWCDLLLRLGHHTDSSGYAARPAARGRPGREWRRSRARARASDRPGGCRPPARVPSRIVPIVVELPPVAAHAAHGREALEALAEGDERPGADHADDLALPDALARPRARAGSSARHRRRRARYRRRGARAASTTRPARRPRARECPTPRRRSPSAARGGRRGPGSGGSAR